MAAGRPREGSITSNSSFYRDDYHNLPYFYSNFKDSAEVTEFLKHKSQNKPGHFLVRPSFKRPSCLTVSVIVKDKTVRHTNIIIENVSEVCKFYYLVPEKKFSCVSDLISFYGGNDVKNLEKVNNVRFLYPVKRRSNSDYNSNSSGGSFSSFHEPTPLSAPDERPQLPPRPGTLPKLSSGSSFGSQASLSRNPSDSSPMNAGIPIGNQFSLSRSVSTTATGSPQNGFLHRGASFERPVFEEGSPVTERPQAPLPPGFHKQEKDPYYSHPRNVDEDISERLKEVLRQSERCDCGIPRDMSDLPLGWTVHRSKDQATYGRIFFQNSDGLTSWKLPDDVQRRLTATQTATLKKLQFMYRKHYSTNYLTSNSHSDRDSDVTSGDSNTHF